MESDSLAFLERLLDTPGPSGYERAPARIWRTQADIFADEVTVDVGGNSFAAINPDGQPRIMLAGHIDEIGLMITHVDDEGFVFFSTIGGWDSQVLVGQRVEIAASQGRVVGVIGKPAIHVIKQEDRNKVSKVTDLWIDIGASGKEDALQRVRVGDAAVLHSTTTRLPNDRLVSRSIDNRIGAFVVLEALRLLTADRPAVGVFAVATAREEIAWNGGGARSSAAFLQPRAAVVVDVTHATDHPNADKKESGECAIGKGPVLSRGSAINPIMFEMLLETAEAEEIPYQLSAAPRDTGTDADAIHNAHHGVATGLISVPNRYMHSPNEMVDLADVEATSRLLASFTRRVQPDTDFVPR